MVVKLGVAAATESSRRAEDGTEPLLAPPRDKAGTDDATGVSQTGAVTAGGTVADGATAAAAPVSGGKPAGAKVSGSATAASDPVPADEAPDTDATDDWENWSQCGLEDDADKWEIAVPPPRIKTSQLTEAEKAKYTGFINAVFKDDNVMWGKRYEYEPEDIMEVVQKVIPYLESEPMLIEDVPYGVSIVGDLHGQLHDLYRVFEKNGKDGKDGWDCGKYLFLGDYVDRGRQSIEVVMTLFCLKMLRPDDFFLLRGNHEFILTNGKYGLYGEMLERYEEECSKILYTEMNHAFTYLSACAIVGDNYFCSHGGMSTLGYTRRQLRACKKPVNRSTDDVVLHDIVWSDPAQGLKASVNNGERKTSIYYGFDDLAYGLACMGCRTLFRGHERLIGGYENLWNTCYTIFTATCTGNERNKGSVAVVDENGKIRIRVLAINESRYKWDKELNREDGIYDDDKDEKTTYDPDLGTGRTKQF